jgi:L-aspartate oxidase
MTMELYEIDGRPLVVGGGLAGMMTALYLAPEPVVLLSKTPLGIDTSSALAQGGIAASLGADDDVSQHIADTLRAGDGLCDATMVERILRGAAQAIEDLVSFGVSFDRGSDGQILLGLEAAHSRKRIVHAGGDASGREIIRAVAQAVRATASIKVIEGFSARRLIVHDGAIAGLVAHGPSGPAGGPVVLPTRRVVLATGGIGGLFQHGTNPAGSFGQGLALAARAGAALADLEFIQFHPTALDTDAFPLKLISEAVRGEGAILVDETGRRFMAAEPGAELAPRDAVARAVWRQMTQGHRTFLDARGARGLDFSRRFPSITELCQAEGIDPTAQPIPIRPAAHYHMGGIKVDREGASTLPGLWACGEVACTGLHGANRLASNSLLEAVVCGRLVAESLRGSAAGKRSLVGLDVAINPGASDPALDHDDFGLNQSKVMNVIDSKNLERDAGGKPVPTFPDPALVRPYLTHAAGVLRDRDGLAGAAAALYPLAASNGPASEPALVGLMIVMAALRREESRGAHMRLDFPAHDEGRIWQRDLTIGEALEAARETIPELVA